jgi:hypothetical protein
MTTNKYQTTFSDSGEHTVTIVASDGVSTVSKDVSIVVNEVNRKPLVIIMSGPRIQATEGDLVKIGVEATDPDNDTLTITYSEPFNQYGEWQTAEGDAGNYVVNISVSDGTNDITNQVLVEVKRKNTPPVIESIMVIPDYVVLKKPGDEVSLRIEVNAKDPDGDKLTITYSGFTTTAERIIKYGEPGGTKTVTVTVSDATDQVSQNVTFEMNNWPCFDCQ